MIDRLFAAIALGLALAIATTPGVAMAEHVGQRVSHPGAKAAGPEVTVAPDGSVHVVWIRKNPPPEIVPEGGHSHLAEDDLMYARSDDGAKTFSAPVEVLGTGGELWGFAVSRPHVRVGDDGVIHLLYPANAVVEATGRTAVATRYTRSLDGGKTFEKPQTLNTYAGVDMSTVLTGGFASAHTFAGFGLAPDGVIHAYWIDTRHMKSETDAGSGALYGAISTDNGATFSKDFGVYTDNTCPCCQVTVAYGPDEVYVGSRLVNGEARDSAISISKDGGRTFTARRVLSETAWNIEGCPLKPTYLETDGAKLYSTWFSGGENPPGVYFNRSLDGGASFEAPMQVHPGSLMSDYPGVARGAGANVTLVWHAKMGGPRRIFKRTSADSGASFGPVSEVGTPPGTSAYPSLAAGPDGTMYVAWLQGPEVWAGRLPDSKQQVALR